MGKPSSNSNHSISNYKMSGVNKRNTHSNKRKGRKQQRKNTKIKKLFTKLRNSVIIINDDPAPLPPEMPAMHCSTPLALGRRGVATPSNTSLDISSIQNNFKDEIEVLTDDINNHNYQTVDLTGEVDGPSGVGRQSGTVIDLNSISDTQDCILVSDNTSMSGDSEVTVLRRRSCVSTNSSVSTNSTVKTVAKGLNGMIANLGPSSQTKLLELITENLFKGCTVPDSLKNNLVQDRTPRIAETPEDTYIKDMFSNRPSISSIGSNIYNPARVTKKTGPRIIVIDGSNVAMEHGKGKFFSVSGLKICIEYFINRGHEVKAFVPRFRCKFGKSSDPKLLDALERRGLVVYTPSREVQGRMITSYDDRYIVQYAAAVDGVIVSGDNYRDLASENPRWRHTIERRVLPFTWVENMIIFPKDPLGRNGPSLEHFLNHHE